MEPHHGWSICVCLGDCSGILEGFNFSQNIPCTSLRATVSFCWVIHVCFIIYVLYNSYIIMPHTITHTHKTDHSSSFLSRRIHLVQCLGHGRCSAVFVEWNNTRVNEWKNSLAKNQCIFFFFFVFLTLFWYPTATQQSGVYLTCYSLYILCIFPMPGFRRKHDWVGIWIKLHYSQQSPVSDCINDQLCRM